MLPDCPPVGHCQVEKPVIFEDSTDFRQMMALISVVADVFYYMVGYNDIETDVFKWNFRCCCKAEIDSVCFEQIEPINRTNLAARQYFIQEDAGDVPGARADIKYAEVCEKAPLCKYVPDFLSLPQSGLPIKDGVTSQLAHG